MKFDRLWQSCKPYLRKGRSIDLIHTRISTDFAWRLLREGAGGDTDIVIPAVMLHDIGYARIDDGDVYMKTTFPDKANAKYDTRVKERHLTEGAKLAEEILRSLEYPQGLIGPIAEIVRTHEDLEGNKPDTTNLNRVIVSDADKLYRYTAYNLTSGMVLHHRTKAQIYHFMLDRIDTWLSLEISKRIAIEELRKLPFDFWPVNEELF